MTKVKGDIQTYLLMEPSNLVTSPGLIGTTLRYLKKKNFHKIYINYLKNPLSHFKCKNIESHIFQLKLVFGVMSYRSEYDFKMFPVVDFTTLGGHFFSLDL